MQLCTALNYAGLQVKCTWQVEATGAGRHHYRHQTSLLGSPGITIAGMEDHHYWHRTSLKPAPALTIFGTEHH